MKELLFELARKAVLRECGDGVVMIVSQQYAKLAKDFEKYEREHDNYFVIRGEDIYESVITFSPDKELPQEGIIFSSDIRVKDVLNSYELVITAMDIFN
jgi:hypothetical protein